MNIAILSLFRDSNLKYIIRYLQDIRGLRDSISYSLRVYAVEGDSETAVTYTILKALDGDLDWFTALKHDTGRPQMGSTVHPDRFLALAGPGNAGLERIARDGWADMVLFLDSDLYWPSGLIERLLSHNLPVTSPLVMIGDIFYDIWAFRDLKGKHWGHGVKWLKDHPLVQVSSSGGVLLFPAWAIRDGARFGKEAIVSLCHDLVGMGLDLWVDTRTVVFHPYNKSYRPEGAEPYCYQGYLEKHGENLCFGNLGG